MSHNWKNILVSPTETIQEVLKVIDSEALQFALVVDTDNRLLGTVTDGDIRRALINDLPLSHSVSDIMFTTPTVVDCSISKVQILELMNTKQLHSIPILDDGIVIGLETIHDVTQKTKYDNPVFLMAGGFGTRLKPLTDNCPKPLLKVGDKPILETVLLSFIKSGFHNFYISTHYLPEMIRDYFGNGEKHDISITYVHEDEPLGTGGALGLLPDDLPDLPLLMINGDVLTTIDFNKVLNFHSKHQAAATMCVREYEYQVPYGVVESKGDTIISMVEKPIQRFFVNAGIYIVGQDIVQAVKKGQHIDMPTLLEENINRGANILKYPVHEYWLDIGRMDDYTRAQADYHSLDFD